MMTVETGVQIDERSLDIPAIVVNRFQAIATPESIRIAFGEGFGGDMKTVRYRTAISLSQEDARQLAVLLQKLCPVT